jgi:Icc-related predicted phosphoesterase
MVFAYIFPMTLESLVVAPDTHKNYHFINSASAIVDKVRSDNAICKKVIQVGDWYERFDPNIAAELKKDLENNPQFQQVRQKLSQLRNTLQAYVKNEYDGDFTKYESDLMAKNVPENILKMHGEFMQLNQSLSKYLDQASITEEVFTHIEGFLEPLKKLKAKNVDIVSVLGNHDPVFLPELLPDVNFIGGEDNDPYENDGIIGHNVSSPPLSGLPDPNMNAPFGKPGDDDVMFGKKMGELPAVETLKEAREKSQWYKRHKDTDANVIVAHHGPQYGHYSTIALGMASKNGNFHTGGGLSALAEDRGKLKQDTLYLCGHVHSGIIYMKNNQLIVNPGPKNIAEVIQDDGDVKAILLYDIDEPHKGAVEIFFESDIQESKYTDGIVWTSSDMLQAA